MRPIWAAFPLLRGRGEIRLGGASQKGQALQKGHALWTPLFHHHASHWQARGVVLMVVLAPESAAFLFPEEIPGSESECKTTKVGLPGDPGRDYQHPDYDDNPEVYRNHEPQVHL